MTKRMYKKSEETINILLDTAEEWFAERGYFGTSVRDITEDAGVRNAGINYHFGTKENLFDEVIKRRGHLLCEKRLDRLNRVTINAKQPEPTTLEIVKAFVEPMLEYAINGGPGWKNYCTLIAHLSVQKFWSDNATSTVYDDCAARFLNALRETYPGADDFLVHASLQFMLGTTIYSVCDNKRIDTLSDGAHSSEDLEKILGPLVKYITAGVMSTLKRQA